MVLYHSVVTGHEESDKTTLPAHVWIYILCVFISYYTIYSCYVYSQGAHPQLAPVFTSDAHFIV